MYLILVNTYFLAMPSSTWFDDLPALGKWPPAQAAAKLREIGETEAADILAPQMPGMGSEMRPEFIEKHRVA